jgi:hypothetical protein
MGIEIANDPAAAMEEDQHRERAAARWRIDSYRNLTRWTRDSAVFDVRYRLRFAKRCRLDFDVRAPLLRGQGVCRGGAQ